MHQNMRQQMKLSFGYCISTFHIPEPSGTRQSAKTVINDCKAPTITRQMFNLQGIPTNSGQQRHKTQENQ